MSFIFLILQKENYNTSCSIFQNILIYSNEDRNNFPSPRRLRWLLLDTVDGCACAAVVESKFTVTAAGATTLLAFVTRPLPNDAYY